ncbi:hypothetical protein D3C72_1703960 [compost metagenome]
MNFPEKIDLDGSGGRAAAGNEFLDLCFVEGLAADDACGSNGNNCNRRPKRPAPTLAGLDVFLFHEVGPL